ncbi:MAG: CHAT domain-containing protein [Trueperaceae bacterium]|nr:CHAT domain-containing protein [Trueperaceae bacterium]
MKTVSLTSQDASFQELLETEKERRFALFATLELSYSNLEELKQEVDKYLNIDPAQAYKLAQLAFDLGSYLGEPEARALGHWSLALGQTVQGEFEAALENYEGARALYKAQGLELESYKVATRQIQALAMRGDFAAALELGKEAEQGFKQHDLLSEAAKVQNNIGIIHWRLGDYQAAIQTLEEVRALYLSLEDSFAVARTDINLGNVYQDLDKFGEARQAFQRAIHYFEGKNSTHLLAGTLIALALTYRREGHLGQVLDTLSRAKMLFASIGENVDLALAQLEEARVRFDLNLLEEAEQLSRELIETFSERNMQLETLEAQTLLGTTLAKKGNYDEAISVLEEAKTGWSGLGNEVQAAWVQLYLATYRLEQGQADASLSQELSTTIQALEQAGSKVGKTVGLMLLALVHERQHGQADLELLHEAESQAQELAVPDLVIRSARLLGLAAQNAGDKDKAESKFRQAIDVLEDVRASLAVDEFKAAYFGEKLEVYTDLIALYLDEERYADAFHFVERSKARAMLDMLASGLQEGQNPVAETLQAQLAEYRTQLNAFYAQAEHDGPQSPVWDNIRELEKRITATRHEIERLNPVKNLQEASVPQVSELQTQLSEKHIVLEYYALNDELVAFILTKEGIRCVRRLGSMSEVKAHLDRLSFAMSRVAQGQAYAQVYSADMLLLRTNAVLQALYDQLIKPLSLDLRGEQLIIVPYGNLHGVPFAALFDGQSYLTDHALLALAPSAAVYLHCAQQKNEGEQELLAFGLPFEDIPTVEKEVKAVSALFNNSKTFLGDAATLEQFQQEAAQAKVLHIATHGVFRPDNPMFSGLKFHNGWLAARDLYQQRLQASLVVLSACETGISSSHASDEVFGLARGFFFAGAPALVVSLWAVKDTQTAQLMIAFYSALNEGKTVAEALHCAQMKVRAEHPNPYFWSAFNLMGDPDRTIV